MDKQNQSDECREAFEAEVAGKLHLGRSLSSGEYRTEVTRLIYVGWCACWNRHTHPAHVDQQAKDAARILGILRDLTNAAEGMAEANNDGSCDYIIKCSYELLAALSTSKQEEV